MGGKLTEIILAVGEDVEAPFGGEAFFGFEPIGRHGFGFVVDEEFQAGLAVLGEALHGGGVGWVEGGGGTVYPLAAGGGRAAEEEVSFWGEPDLAAQRGEIFQRLALAVDGEGSFAAAQGLAGFVIATVSGEGGPDASLGFVLLDVGFVIGAAQAVGSEEAEGLQHAGFAAAVGADERDEWSGGWQREREGREVAEVGEFKLGDVHRLGCGW